MKKFILIFALGCLGFGGVGLFQSLKSSENLFPVLGTLEPFVLRDQGANRVTEKQFHGKISVVDFIFTRCPGICPLLTQRMSELEARTRHLGNQVQFISISVDPEHDMPVRLKEYMQKQSLISDRWLFLTGPLDSIEKVVVGSFKTLMGKRNIASEEEEEPDLMQITHGEHFILVDREGQLRFFHKAQSVEDLESIYQALDSLL